MPAPESNHAVRVAIDEALAAREEGRQRTILFNLSGHGHFDLAAYESYLAGRLEDYEYVPLEPQRPNGAPKERGTSRLSRQVKAWPPCPSGQHPPWWHVT